MATGEQDAHAPKTSPEMEQSSEKRMHFCISSKKRDNNTVINKIIMPKTTDFFL
jgi:hypothetical protein